MRIVLRYWPCLFTAAASLMLLSCEAGPAPLDGDEAQTADIDTEAEADAEALPRLVIEVAADDWGGADREDMLAVLESAAAEFMAPFPTQRLGTVIVSRSTDGPIVLYERGPGGAYRVKLDVSGRYWAQLAFQFGHELCHILCRYREGPNANRWFEESLCETASLYVLRRMAAMWKESPPYPNWRGFAEALGKYADERIERSQLPEGTTLAQWYAANAKALREGTDQREKYLIVAVQLLELLEETPEHWEAVWYVNEGRHSDSQSLQAYLRQWQEAAPARHRAFIASIAERLGAELP